MLGLSGVRGHHRLHRPTRSGSPLPHAYDELAEAGAGLVLAAACSTVSGSFGHRARWCTQVRSDRALGVMVHVQRRGRHGRNVVGAVTGLVVGALVTGLVLPFAVGERTATTAQDAGPLVDSRASNDGASADVGAPLDDAAGAGSGSTDAPSSAAASSAGDGAAAGASGGGAAPGSASQPGRPDSTTGGGAPLRATDRGVTPSASRVGFALLDLGGASALGLAVAGYSIEEQKRAIQVFVDDINRRGGVNGRKIEPYYRASDPLNRDSSQALCLGFSRDDKVFAVIAQPGFRAHLCVAEQEQMVLMIDFAASDIIARSGGRIITTQQSGNRMMFDWIGELDRMGVLKGKKIGILGDEDTANGDRQAVETGVLPALRQLGYTVTYRSRLSANLNTGAGQIPVEVQQMRSAGVDAVLLATNFVYATQFVQAADAQRWRPAWFTSDHNGLAGDDLMENMPPSFDGAISVTVSRAPERELRERQPEAAIDRECREFYNAAVEDDVAYGDTSPVPYSCGQLRLFATAASALGPDVTRGRLGEAVQAQRSFRFPGLFGGGFGPGKLDYADVVRPLRWQAGCKCWRYTGPPTRVRF